MKPLIIIGIGEDDKIQFRVAKISEVELLGLLEYTKHGILTGSGIAEEKKSNILTFPSGAMPPDLKAN